MKYFQYKIFYRYDRVFLPYPVKGNNITFDEYNKQCQKVRCARIHLKYLCDKTLQKEHGTNLDVAEEQTALDNLLLDIQTRQHPALGNFLFAFIYRTEDPSVTQCMAKLLSLLIGDAAISSVVPFRYHQHLLQTCFKVRNHQDFRDHLNEMKEYGVELSDLLRTSNFHGFSTKCVEFLEYLIDQTVLVHSHDQILQQAQPINNSYNPETGTAYYFTSHGCQVRKQPVYTIIKKVKIMMMYQLLIICARKNFLKFHMVDMATCFCGFVPFTAIVMAFTWYLEVKVERIHFLLFSSIYQNLLQIFSMTLLVNTVNIAWIENHSISWRLDFGMTYFTVSHTNVENVLNLLEYVAWWVSILKYVSSLIRTCSVLSTQHLTYHNPTSCSLFNSLYICGMWTKQINFRVLLILLYLEHCNKTCTIINVRYCDNNIHTKNFIIND